MDEPHFTAQVFFFSDFEGFFQKEIMIYFELELTVKTSQKRSQRKESIQPETGQAQVKPVSAH